MHAGWNPKPLITAMGIGWLESHDSSEERMEEERREEGENEERESGRRAEVK